MQFSLSEDGSRADIDVDYRSSRPPKALFNGHLTAANSDVRVGRNPRLHNGRWNGFVAWWQDVFGQLDEVSEPSGDLLYANRPPVPTALPSDRPLGAAPERIEDAVQEFFTDWLIRRRYDQALDVLSPQAYACLDLDGNGGSEPLRTDRVRAELREVMEDTSDQLGTSASLTDAIAAVQPPAQSRAIISHAFSREFVVISVNAAEAMQYGCGQSAAQPAKSTYHEVIFRFRREDSGTMALLWRREGQRWRLLSYRLLTP
jgi:hypothetical protein